MDESYAGFNRDIFYIGRLQSSGLVDGASFNPIGEPGKGIARVGVGNRINLYVRNRIRYIDTDPPQYGLIPIWQFSSYERQLDNVNGGGNEFWVTGGTAGPYRSAWYKEMYPEYADASPANPHVKAASMNYKFLALPNKIDDGSEGYFSEVDERPPLVIPIIAMGDFMRIKFYSRTSSGDPYEYGEEDVIQIWATVGHDAVGGNFPVG